MKKKGFKRYYAHRWTIDSLIFVIICYFAIIFSKTHPTYHNPQWSWLPKIYIEVSQSVLLGILVYNIDSLLHSQMNPIESIPIVPSHYKRWKKEVTFRNRNAKRQVCALIATIVVVYGISIISKDLFIFVFAGFIGFFYLRTGYGLLKLPLVLVICFDINPKATISAILGTIWAAFLAFYALDLNPLYSELANKVCERSAEALIIAPLVVALKQLQRMNPFNFYERVEAISLRMEEAKGRLWRDT